MKHQPRPTFWYPTALATAAATTTLVATAAWAAPKIDGQINTGEYAVTVKGEGRSAEGKNLGGSFNGAFGAKSTLHLDASATSLFIGVEMFGALANQDIGVIYLDTTEGGAPSTEPLDGNGNHNENAIAGDDGFFGDTAAELIFGEGFRPDFALTFESNGFIGLYQLDAAKQEISFVDGLDINKGSTFNGIFPAVKNSSDKLEHEIEISLATLGLEAGDTLGYLGNVLNGASPYRSNEFFGVSKKTVSTINNDGYYNVGTDTLTLTQGEHGTFTIGSAAGEEVEPE